MSTHTLGLIGSATDGLENVRTSLVESALARGWQVAVTLTPTAGTWLEDNGEWGAGRGCDRAVVPGGSAEAA